MVDGIKESPPPECAESSELSAAKKRIAELEAENERHRLYLSLSGRLLELVDEAIFHTDTQLRLRQANPAFYRLLGSSSKELAGKGLKDFLSSGDEGLHQGLKVELDRTGVWEGEIRREGARGETLTETLLLASVLDSEGEVEAYVGIIRNLTALRRAKASLEYTASHDSLTGLHNREYFHAAVEELARKTEASGEILAICILDLDDFKRVNNDLSREAGDELLKAIGLRLSGALRSGDLIARSGGDEFSLALPFKSRNELKPLVARILGLFDAPFECSGRLIYLTATMGVSLCPDQGLDAARLSACADLALQSRKGGGKSGYATYHEELGTRLQGKASLASELKRALSHGKARDGNSGRLFLQYQPIVDMGSGLVVSAEALARWEHPEHGSISPGRFIPIAEESGLIVELGELVLRTACGQARAWQSTLLRPPRVCVNVSARQLQEPGFVKEVRQSVAGLPKGLVTLEITESQLFEDLDRAASVLGELKGTGVLLSVDDFGTGYASLSYLKKLPMDIIKIDQSFVTDLARNRQDRRIVEAVASLARELGAQTIAEGVETKAQFELLKEIGCDYAQGFLFSPSLPAEGIPALVEGGYNSAGNFTGRR